MRQGPSSKRLRGRGGRKNMNPRSQNFESNGPEVKVRGNAQQVVEKYLALARDATSADDRVAAENYFQHAEHYYRVMTANGGGHEQRDHHPQQQQQPTEQPPAHQSSRASQPDKAGVDRNGEKAAPAKSEITIEEKPAASPADDSDGDTASA